MTISYDTQSLTPSNQLEYWQEVVCKHYVTAHSRTDRSSGNDRFDARLICQEMGQIRVGQYSAPMVHWSRRTEDLRRDEQEVYIISLLRRGMSELSQFGRRVVQHSGDIVIYDATAPFEYSLHSDARLVKIPKAYFDTRVKRARDFVGILFPANFPLMSSLSTLIEEAIKLDVGQSANALIGSRLSSSMVEIIVAMCDLLRDSTGGLSESRLQRVMGYVQVNLDREDLTPSRMAEVAGMSLRSLNREFAALGTTPMRWVWTQRLSASHQALSERRVKSVTEAAMQCGFNELGHFSRSFKNTYGVTPLQVLRG